MLIITHSRFLSQAEKLAQAHSSMLGTEGTADYLVDAVKRRFGLE
jgi:hypothetical protein